MQVYYGFSAMIQTRYAPVPHSVHSLELTFCVRKGLNNFVRSE